ncbi:MAG: threonine-phosphate decarboxylase [Lachnospiraceae bacterium]|nr:threonine-phosphate decarboxylase [Lachnospiraceae bacterium]
MNKAHGGNIYKAARKLGLAENQILDFSANISPLGLPDYIRKAMIESIEGTINYPDPECTALREAIANNDETRTDFIACGNGGADLLYRLAFGMKFQKVLLPVPSFVEYEEAFGTAGAKMKYYKMDTDFTIRQDILDEITDDTDLLILCNPNNPTGILTPRDLILQILEKAERTGTYVLVDECFLEICRCEKDYTVKPYLDVFKHLMILKSFTKMYAIPGVRLGYLLSGNPEVIASVNRAGQAWSVSHIAQCAGVAALGHEVYKETVIYTVEKELKFMKEELDKLPLHSYDGAANYIFFQAPGVTDLDERLLEKGIMIRNCSNYVNLGNDYWRVAVKAHEENVRLIKALHEVLD